jgi:hypothetical protein
MDFEVEAAYQYGRSLGSSLGEESRSLDHRAHFEHIEIGYSFAGLWMPRLAAQLDYASGDRNPGDDQNNRFDSLYGSRGFDFGPTGIYGAFARSNLISPGYRVSVNPAPDVELMVAHRYFRLASKTDAWTSGGWQDLNGESGNDLGHQVEARVTLANEHRR